MTTKDIGEKLKEQRMCHGLSQYELGKQSGVNRRVISQAESDTRPLSVIELFQIDKALDDDLVWALMEIR